MINKIKSIEEFEKQNEIYQGEWELSYSDNRYLPDDEYIPFGKIEFDEIDAEKLDQEYGIIINSFNLSICSFETITDKKHLFNSDSGKSINDEKFEKFIDSFIQALSKSLTRTGILTPEIDKRNIDDLNNENILILVHETNAIVNGTTNYLLHELGNKNILNIIPKIIQFEIQEKADHFKSKKDGKYNAENRAFSTNALRVINQIKKDYPLEYIGDIAELFITKKIGDKRNVFYDRITVETIKNIYGSRNINGKVFLVTSDFDMARFARMENVDVFYSKFRRLKSNEKLYSTRFSLLKKDFYYCSIYDLLWDLTNLFSKIKLRNIENNKTFTFNYYLPGKQLHNWENDQLEIEVSDLEQESSDFEQEFKANVRKFADTTKRSIKMTGLKNLLTLTEMLHQSDQININQCRERLNLAKTTCKDYFHVLEGIGLIKLENDEVASATNLVKIFIEEWEKGNIENLIEILRNYVPFDSFLKMMEKIKYIDKHNINIEQTKQILSNHGINDYKALRLFPNIGTQLGILFPLGEKIYWANEKPTYEIFEESFLKAYNKHKISEGYASIVDVINDVCSSLNISIRMFEELFSLLYLKNKNKIETGGSVITTSKNMIELLVPREPREQRFNKHVLEDGIEISGNFIKSIKLGVNYG